MEVDIDFAMMIAEVTGKVLGVIVTLTMFGGVKHLAGYAQWAIDKVAGFFGR